MKFIRSAVVVVAALLLLADAVVAADEPEQQHQVRRRGLLQDVQDGGGKCKTVTTVENFDIERYASKPWYVHQQAVNAYSPRSRNYCTRAEYTVRDRPTFWGYTVDVNNVASDADGSEFGGNLCAYQTDSGSASKLAVAPCFLPKSFAGAYWVVAYDEEAGYALVSGGQPKRPGATAGLCRTGAGVNDSGLWIFTRSRIRDDGLVSRVRAIAADKGFDVSVLNDVDQDGCKYD